MINTRIKELSMIGNLLIQKCKEIGYSKDGKSITYYEGESEDKYLHTKEKNKYGKTKMYEIVIADKEYKK